MRHTLASDRFGAASSGRPVVFVHGAFVTHAMGRSALPASLIDQHPCLSVGLPGHAGSPPGAWADATAEGLADLLAATLREAGIGDDAAVVGHSLGGLAALCLACRRPGRVAAVACVSGTAGGLFRGGEHATPLQRVAVAAAASPTAFQLGVRLGSCSVLLHRWLAGLAAGDAAALRRSPGFRAASRAYLPALWRAPTEPMRRALRALAGLDLRENLPELALPTLFLHGGADPVFPVGAAGDAAAACSAARLAVLPGVGHLPMFEAPAACGRTLQAWIDSIDR
ncbi:alpha/beta fold hydrolase [Phycisphaera mikurensis]|nr:alpha/beta hydrolase [Phycisphaera mikurensis]MBB6441319.1 pimeloyl-ACP methyl ester carboxylesterase [Phycisphaera mikurensis]